MGTTAFPHLQFQGWTPLHGAAREGAKAWAVHLHAEGYNTLARTEQEADILTKGTDCVKYSKGMTAAQVARKSGFETVAGFLEVMTLVEDSNEAEGHMLVGFGVQLYRGIVCIFCTCMATHPAYFWVGTPSKAGRNRIEV